ncbi:hypothetical protein EGT07_01395 [Herbaspirillum sp. HC18]|nr:hypothetical protein EGT07_01395 [Herbaspirillum sp. HC18]
MFRAAGTYRSISRARCYTDDACGRRNSGNTGDTLGRRYPASSHPDAGSRRDWRPWCNAVIRNQTRSSSCGNAVMAAVNHPHWLDASVSTA